MSVIATALRAMLAAGMSDAQIVAAVEEMEAALEPSRSPRQARNARYYAAKKGREERLKASESVLNSDAADGVLNRLKPSETVLNKTPLARVENNPLRIITLEADAAAVDAREPEPIDDWPGGDARAHAAELVGLAQTSRLDIARQPGLTLTLGCLPRWKAAGASWKFDVVPVVTTLARKKGQPIGTWTYFDNAIAQSIADNRKALEIPEANDRPPPRKSARDDRLQRMLSGAMAAADG